MKEKFCLDLLGGSNPSGKCSNQLFFLVWVAIQNIMIAFPPKEQEKLMQTADEGKGAIEKKTTQKAVLAICGENTLVSRASLSTSNSRDTSTRERITWHKDAFTCDTIILYIKSLLAAAVVMVPPLLTPRGGRLGG